MVYYKQISTNTALKFISEIIGRAATFALLIWAARQLTESDLGYYNYGLAVGFILSQLASLGLPIIITRTVAAHGLTAKPIVITGLHIKLILAIPVTLLFCLLFLGTSPLSLYLNLVALGLITLLNTFVEYIAHIFRGQNDIPTEATLFVTMRGTTAVTAAIALWLGWGLTGLTLCYLLTVTAVTAWGLHLLKQKKWIEYLPILPINSRAAYTHLLKEALPLGIATFLSIAYLRLPILLLQHQLDAEAVAHYSIVHQLIEPMQIIPASLFTAVFPIITPLLQNEPTQARRLGWQATGLLALIGTLLALLLWFSADWLIIWLYGENFTISIPILKTLCWSLIFSFINYSLTHYLIALGQQHDLMRFTALMFGQHLLLSSLLIPLWATVGPALSVIVAEGTLLLCCLFALKYKAS